MGRRYNMIEITLSELMDSASVMQELAKKPMKTKAAFQTARLMREIEKEYSLFQESRKGLIDKYADKDENGEPKADENGNYTVPKENIEEFNKELKDMLDQTLSLNVEPISIEDLGDADFTPADMMLLAPFMKE